MKKEAWQYHLLNVNQLDHVLSTIKYKCIEPLNAEITKDIRSIYNIIILKTS